MDFEPAKGVPGLIEKLKILCFPTTSSSAIETPQQISLVNEHFRFIR